MITHLASARGGSVAYLPGDVFAGFTIDRVLGTGGMGTVYLAHHPRLPRRDALKLLRADLSADPGFRARFEREADLASRLDHRNIVTVYDRGCTDEQLWIDMQYVDGIDASQALESDPAALTVERSLRIVSEVGLGLDFAHRHGLWHRDVKPANILLSAGADPDEPERVMLTDFGVAKAVDEARQLTSTGNMLATLAYAAPEQIESRALDHRVDIYALGCVLYELLTGRVPFPEQTAYATMAAHLKKPPPRPSEVSTSLPPGSASAIDDVVAQAMAKDRDERFGSCRELAQAARAALHRPAEPTRAVTPVRTAPVTQTVRPLLRSPAVSPSVSPPAPASAPPTQGPQPTPGAQRTPGPPSRPPPPVATPTGGRGPEAPLGPRPPYQLRVRRTDGRDPGAVLELGPVFTDTLSLLETGALEDLLDRAQFFRLPPHLSADRQLPGDGRQEITVISAGRTQSVSYDVAGSRRPPELDEFVSRLERLAGWRRIGPPAAPAPAPAAAPPHPPTGSVPTPRTPWWKRKALVAAVVALVVLAGIGAVLLGGGPGTLAAPASIDAVSQGTAVEVSWEAVAEASRYQVLRDGDPVGTTGGTAFTDDGVEAGTRYRYTVVALGANGLESEASTGRSVTVPVPTPPPPAPTGVSVSAMAGVVTVTWEAVDGASTYNLFRGTVRLYGGPETTYVDENAPQGTNRYSVLASTVDGTLSERSTAAPITLSDTWGDLTYIVDAFPNLLPADPTKQSYEKSTCGVEASPTDIHTDGVAVCDYPNGIHLELLHYPDDQALQARVAETATESIEPTSWGYEGNVDGGTLYESPAGGDTTWRFATFVAPERAPFGLYVSWPGHTDDELFDTWWFPAPF